MKNRFIVSRKMGFIVLLGFILFCFVILLTGGDKATLFRGYIPAEEKPSVTWIKQDRSGSYYPETTIGVVVNGNDTIRAIYNEVGFDGMYLVKYHESYPPSLGKVVFIQGIKKGESYRIERASLVPYE
ncbi:MAG: hypothetical protein PHT84_00605 [Candidatus Pacebacteria bacterium]|nr:hypothetical protein [Candidatus Paceibacterota bacterium]